MRSSDRRKQIASELGYLDDGGSVDYHAFMHADIDWNSYIADGTYTKDELQLAALVPPDFKEEQDFIIPPVQSEIVPIDLEILEDIGDGKYRIQFLTIADDGYPTRVEEVVTPEGDLETWLTEYLDDARQFRARLNQKAIEKEAERSRIAEQIPVGNPDNQMKSTLDSKFPYIKDLKG